jgi:hypothetical protein
VAAPADNTITNVRMERRMMHRHAMRRPMMHRRMRHGR